MWDQEKKHLQTFEQIIADRRVRPTVLIPLWNVAGFVLGIYVVVQFYPRFKFYFPLYKTYYHTLSYPKTKENKI